MHLDKLSNRIYKNSNSLAHYQVSADLVFSVCVSTTDHYLTFALVGCTFCMAPII